MRRDEVRVERRCAQRWTDLRGSGVRRQCEQCQEPVTNLSLLTESQARDVIARGAQCVAYRFREDGSVVFAETLRRSAPRVGVAAAALLAAACADGAASPKGAETKSERAANAQQLEACDRLLGAERRAANRREMAEEQARADGAIDCETVRQLQALGYMHGRSGCDEE